MGFGTKAKIKIKGRIISKGYAEGEAIVSKKKISFLGDVDPKTGVVIDKNSDIYGESISGKVFIFPFGKGSTVGTYILLQMVKNGVNPKAIVNKKTDVVVASGAIIAEIPLIDEPERDIFEIIKTGDFVKVNAYEGWIEIERR